MSNCLNLHNHYRRTLDSRLSSPQEEKELSFARTKITEAVLLEHTPVNLFWGDAVLDKMEASSCHAPEASSLNRDELLDEQVFRHAYQEFPLMLGQGSNGSVKAGRDQRSGSPVAIKRNLPTHMPNQRELNALLLLRSTRVRHRLNIRDAFQLPSNILALVTDRIPSSNLHLTKGRLSFSDIVTVSRQMLEHLQDLRERNILHGDIKPSNIIYEFENRYTTLLDNGLSFDLNSTDVTGKLLQNKYYRAPEIILRKHVTPAADLWSLGSVLYEIMTGDVLFEDKENLPFNPEAELGFAHRQAAWQDSLWKAGQRRGLAPGETLLFIQLLAGMLKLEDRTPIEELLASPLFQNDISFHLLNHLPQGHLIKMYRSCDLEAGGDEPDPCLLINPADRVTRSCYHIPKDPLNSYIVKLEDREGAYRLWNYSLTEGCDLNLDLSASSLVPFLENLHL